MKKIFLICTLFISYIVSAQMPTIPGVTNINQRYQWIDGYIWQKLVLPQDTTFSKVGVAQKGTTIYLGNGSWWTAVGGSSITAGYGLTGTSVFKVDTTHPGGINTIAYNQFKFDSLNALILHYTPSANPPPAGRKIVTVGDGTVTDVADATTLTDGVVGNGCPVFYSGSGLTWTIGTPCSYNIGGVQYNYPGGNVTLSTADPSNPRLDNIVVTTSNSATSVTGTAAVSPAIPDIDQTTQLTLTTVLVNAGATTPAGVGQVIVRDVNYAGGDWFMSRTATIDSIYATNPFHSTLSVRLTAATNNQYFQYNSRLGALFSKAAYNTLILYIRNNSVLNAARTLTLRLFNGTTQVGNALPLTTYGYSKTVTGVYQTVAIPMSAFAGADAFNAIRITNTGTGGTLDVQFDYVQMQSGIVISPPPASLLFGRTDVANNTGAQALFNSNGQNFILNNGKIGLNSVAPTYTNSFGEGGVEVGGFTGTSGNLILGSNNQMFVQAHGTFTVWPNFGSSGSFNYSNSGNDGMWLDWSNAGNNIVFTQRLNFTGTRHEVVFETHDAGDPTFFKWIAPGAASADSLYGVDSNGDLVLVPSSGGGGAGGGGWNLTGTTTLTGSAIIDAGSNSLEFDATNTSLILTPTVFAIGNSAIARIKADSDDDLFEIRDYRVTPRGIEYHAHYWTDYSEYSLIDKGYFESQTVQVTHGTSAPSSTPVNIGDWYIDTSAKKLYFATGTSSSSDWIIAN